MWETHVSATLLQAMSNAYDHVEDCAENAPAAKRQKTKSTGATAEVSNQFADQVTSCSANAYHGMLPDPRCTVSFF